MSATVTSINKFPPVARRDGEGRGVSADQSGSLTAPQIRARLSPWRAVRALTDVLPLALVSAFKFESRALPRAYATIRSVAGIFRAIGRFISKGTKGDQFELAANDSIYLGFGNDPYVPPSTKRLIRDLKFVRENRSVRHDANMNERSNRNYGQQDTKRVPKGHGHD